MHKQNLALKKIIVDMPSCQIKLSLVYIYIYIYITNDTTLEQQQKFLPFIKVKVYLLKILSPCQNCEEYVSKK